MLLWGCPKMTQWGRFESWNLTIGIRPLICWFGKFFLGVYVEEHYYHECVGMDPLHGTWSAVPDTSAQPAAVDRKPQVQHDFNERRHLSRCHWRSEHLQDQVRLVQHISYWFMFIQRCPMSSPLDGFLYDILFTLTIYPAEFLVNDDKCRSLYFSVFLLFIYVQMWFQDICIKPWFGL